MRHSASSTDYALITSLYKGRGSQQVLELDFDDVAADEEGLLERRHLTRAAIPSFAATASSAILAFLFTSREPPHKPRRSCITLLELPAA